MKGYLRDLTLRLARGVAALDDGQRARHLGFFSSAQRSDGGFAGREGGSDPYYTSFGLRSLALLGELYGDVARRAAEFLQGRLIGQESLVDFFTLLYSAELLQVSADIDLFAASRTDWRKQVTEFLLQLRRDDGGFAKTEEGAASSTYQTFLVCVAFDMLHQPIPESDRIVEFLRSQQMDDGGFREIRAARRGGTNPTAAAIGALRILDRLDEESTEGAIDFLLERQSDEGGLTANTRIPIADVLSTFTGLVTLTDLGARDEVDLAAIARFVAELESPDGGFRAALWDDRYDVEYSFYGLGTLALLADPASDE